MPLQPFLQQKDRQQDLKEAEDVNEPFPPNPMNHSCIPGHAHFTLSGESRGLDPRLLQEMLQHQLHGWDCHE